MVFMTNNGPKRRLAGGITAISVSGFKSLADEYRIGVRPLTILAGANSSGKSSAMQPLLMLKQTLDATYDPGPLLLNGPNVRFTSANQLLSRLPGQAPSAHFTVGFSVGSDAFVSTFRKEAEGGLSLVETRYQNGTEEITLRPDMTHEALMSQLPKRFQGGRRAYNDSEGKWGVVSSRCFLTAALYDSHQGRSSLLVGPVMPSDSWDAFLANLTGTLIHVPGLRGNPQRTYKRTAVGPTFAGTFEPYVASIIHNWESTKNQNLVKLANALATLGLTNQIDAQKVNDVEFEIRVGQLPLSATKDGVQPMINIADVGFGVSQVLPVLVALLTAKAGQMVYLEQPELHLHPRAQAALAQLLIDAARRGVRVVTETHSSLLLTAIQTLVAEGKIAPNEVMLHWFQRRQDSVTQITSTELDEAGAFGEWPEDFGQVLLEVEGHYIDAAQERLMGG